MSSILRSALALGARPYSRRVDATGDASGGRSAVIDPWHDERERLLARISALEEVAERQDEAMAAAMVKAREEGRRAGLGEASSREGERVVVLKQGLDAAHAMFAEKLDLLDFLAPALARMALDKMFDDCLEWQGPVTSMIERQLSTLRREAVIAIHVSPSDFNAGNIPSHPCARVSLDPDLRAGACRIDCKAGRVDLDARTQWAELGAILDGMAR